MAIDGGAKEIDASLASAAVQAYLEDLNGVTGNVTVDGARQLTVTVTVTYNPILLDLFGGEQHDRDRPGDRDLNRSIADREGATVARTAPMIDRGRQALAGIGALTVVALIIALPVLLVWAAGNPLPGLGCGSPAWSKIRPRLLARFGMPSAAGTTEISSCRRWR
ncbi:hypothetical protein NKG94_17335 [Micromonospora sp. M12]